MTIIYNYKFLEELPEETFEALIRFAGNSIGSGTTMGEFYHALKKMPRSRRGVLIKTECGQEKVFLPSQPVESIYIDGKLVYHSCKESAKT